MTGAKSEFVSTRTLVSVDSLEIHDMANNMILIADAIGWNPTNQNRGYSSACQCLSVPPIMSRDARAISNAFPHELRLIIDIC